MDSHKNSIHTMREENKRIVKNTAVVYTRLVITTLLGLVSSRFVLKALGASDFGLYNVVGSIVVIFSFLNAALYSTTTRFLNYEQGKENGDVNRVFNVSFAVHIGFAVITLALLETIGVIYINHFLNVSVGKEADAMFVFQVSTVISCIGIVCVPFQSVFISKEKFSFVAIVDITGAIIKFALIVLLLYYNGNVLRFYAVSMALVLLMTNVIYFIESHKRYLETVKYKFVKEKGAYKEILTFNNYNLLGTAALIVRNQGSNMLINFFFGTIVNAAYAIAYSVQGYIISFVSNFDTASSPQITQSFSGCDMNRAIFLTTTTCRICMLLTMLLLFPIYVELDFVLQMWLGENVPDGADQLCKYTLIVALVSSTSGGVTQLIQSVGKLKYFILQYAVLYLVALVSGFVFFTKGFPPYSIILAYATADIISRANQLFLLHKLIGFKVGLFIRDAYIRPTLVLFGGILYCCIASQIEISSITGHVINVVLAIFFMLLVIFFIGLFEYERNIVVSKFDKIFISKH